MSVRCGIRFTNFLFEENKHCIIRIVRVTFSRIVEMNTVINFHICQTGNKMIKWNSTTNGMWRFVKFFFLLLPLENELCCHIKMGGGSKKLLKAKLGRKSFSFRWWIAWLKQLKAWEKLQCLKLKRRNRSAIECYSNVQLHRNSLTDLPLNKLTFFQFISTLFLSLASIDPREERREV